MILIRRKSCNFANLFVWLRLIIHVFVFPKIICSKIKDLDKSFSQVCGFQIGLVSIFVEIGIFIIGPSIENLLYGPYEYLIWIDDDCHILRLWNDLLGYP